MSSEGISETKRIWSFIIIPGWYLLWRKIEIIICSVPYPNTIYKYSLWASTTRMLYFLDL